MDHLSVAAHTYRSVRNVQKYGAMGNLVKRNPH